MNKQDAHKILGYNRDRDELLKMKRALSMFSGFFNTEEDSKRLEAIKVLLKK